WRRMELTPRSGRWSQWPSAPARRSPLVNWNITPRYRLVTGFSSLAITGLCGEGRRHRRPKPPGSRFELALFQLGTCGWLRQKADGSVWRYRLGREESIHI